MSCTWSPGIHVGGVLLGWHRHTNGFFWWLLILNKWLGNRRWIVYLPTSYGEGQCALGYGENKKKHFWILHWFNLCKKNVKTLSFSWPNWTELFFITEIEHLCSRKWMWLTFQLYIDMQPCRNPNNAFELFSFIRRTLVFMQQNSSTQTFILTLCLNMLVTM